MSFSGFSYNLKREQYALFLYAYTSCPHARTLKRTLTAVSYSSDAVFHSAGRHQGVLRCFAESKWVQLRALVSSPTSPRGSDCHIIFVCTQRFTEQALRYRQRGTAMKLFDFITFLRHRSIPFHRFNSWANNMWLTALVLWMISIWSCLWIKRQSRHAHGRLNLTVIGCDRASPGRMALSPRECWIRCSVTVCQNVV